jgi:hypothetical protein
VKNLRRGEGGPPRRGVERGGARGGEAPAAGASSSATGSAAAAAGPTPGGGIPISGRSIDIFSVLCSES